MAVCGVQEARTPPGTARCGPFWRCCSGADAVSNYGNELWLHTGLNLASGTGDQVFFKPDCCITLHAEPTILLVKVLIADSYWCFAVIHAPHRARPLESGTSWWRRLEDLCAQQGPDCHWFVLGDCNARVGSCCSPHIGGFQADEGDDSGELMHGLLRRLQCTVPSTFSHQMYGAGHTLVQKRNGGLARCDFVCIPLALSTSLVQSWVDARISDGHSSLDHFATLVRLQLTWMGRSSRSHARAPRIDVNALRDPAIASVVSQVIRNAPSLTWEVNAHQHAAELTHHLYAQLVERFPADHRRLRRGCFSSASDQIHKAISQARHKLRSQKVGYREGPPSYK